MTVLNNRPASGAVNGATIGAARRCTSCGVCSASSGNAPGPRLGPAVLFARIAARTRLSRANGSGSSTGSSTRYPDSRLPPGSGWGRETGTSARSGRGCGCPRSASQLRSPPASTVSSTSLTVPPWVLPTVRTASRSRLSIANRRAGPSVAAVRAA